MKTFLFCIGLTATLACGVRAEVPEPDSILFGLVYAGTNQVSQLTAANTNVVIEARRTPTGPALASYTMGSRVALGDYYSLRLSLESVVPVVGIQSFQAGDTFYLTLTDSGSVRAQMPLTVGTRGQIQRMDFKSANIPADWLSRLKHPADNAPADNSISSAELDAYSVAWKTGQAWPIEPNPIPVGYVSRAGALWMNAGSYVFDPSRVASAPNNNPSWWATNAPLWWTTQVPAVPTAAGSSLARTVPATYQPGVPLSVTVSVQCGAAVGVYAVEEQPPAGWKVSNLSDGGVFDAVNQKVKWGLFRDNTARALTYTLTPPSTATGDATFSGQGGFDGQLFATGGQTETGPGSPGNAPHLLANRSPGGPFKFKLQGSPGDRQTVDVSTNLVNWISLTNIVLDASGAGELTDADSIKLPRRFYRTRDANE